RSRHARRVQARLRSATARSRHGRTGKPSAVGAAATPRAIADRVTGPWRARPLRRARPQGPVNSQAGVRPWLSVARECFLSGTVRGHARRAFRRSVAAWRRGRRDFLRVLFANGDTGYTYPSPFVILVR